MSGYADYQNESLKDYPVYNVPVIEATSENFKEYGHFVKDYDNEEVIIVPWPVSGWRKLMFNTGTEGGITEGKFQYWYQNGLLRAKNHAVGGDYITGINYEVGDGNQVPKYILNREANYHPDGGQVFYPLEKAPFILLLALPGDDVKPEDFIAFKFDGSCGAQIKPNIWHQPAYPLISRMDFMTKQGKVHGCVGVDTIDEFQKWLKIDL